MTRIFVGNLPHDVREFQLRSLFAPHGRVSSVQIKTDQATGRPRGFAFVSMPSSEDAEEAIARLSRSALNGRPLTVNEAQASNKGGQANEAERKRVLAIFDSL